MALRKIAVIKAQVKASQSAEAGGISDVTSDAGLDSGQSNGATQFGAAVVASAFGASAMNYAAYSQIFKTFIYRPVTKPTDALPSHGAPEPPKTETPISDIDITPAPPPVFIPPEVPQKAAAEEIITTTIAPFSFAAFVGLPIATVVAVPVTAVVSAELDTTPDTPPETPETHEDINTLVAISPPDTALPSLFTEGNDNISFDAVTAGIYDTSSYYDALGGNDTVFLPSTAGVASSIGYDLNTQFTGGGGDDTIFGSTTDDNIAGGSGNDTLVGGDGNDILAGGPGMDDLQGGPADDVLIINTDLFDFAFDGGEGIDTVSFGDMTGYSLIISNLDTSLIDIEQFDINGGSDGGIGDPQGNTLTIVGEDVAAMNTDSFVRIFGGADDNVVLQDSFIGPDQDFWTPEGTDSMDGITFNIYTTDFGSFAYIEDAINVTVVGP